MTDIDDAAGTTMENHANAIIRRVEDTKFEYRGEIEKRVFFAPGEGSDLLRFTMYRAKPGLESDLHTNPGDDASYVIQGELEVEVDGELIHVKAGDSFILRKGVPHKATVVGTEDLILISAHCEFCPLFQTWNESQDDPQVHIGARPA